MSNGDTRARRPVKTMDWLRVRYSSFTNWGLAIPWIIRESVRE
jgi:hypothetical protein